MIDNVIPYIGGEEEKSEQEPLKLFGTIDQRRAGSSRQRRRLLPLGVSGCRLRTVIWALCLPASTVCRRSKRPLKSGRILREELQELKLPSAPEHFLTYFTEDNRPQTKLDRDLEHGMGISIGRLRKDTQYDIKFVCLSHNTIRGAAGGGVLMAELLCSEGYIES